MRTPEQIENLRGALYYIIGPFVQFLSAEEINKWADNLQAHIDRMEKREWIIKVQLTDTKTCDWDKIEPEKKHPIASLDKISDFCYSMLIQYPRLLRIEITNKDDLTEKHIFTRD